MAAAARNFRLPCCVWITPLAVCCLLDVCFVTFADSLGKKADGGGFDISKFAGLKMFALQCNGTHLPSDVRSLQYISLQRHPLNSEVTPHIIASLSPVDGVRLENVKGNANVFVSGVFDIDNIQSTSLTLLMSDVTMETDMTYGCRISFIKRGGSLEIIERTLNVSFSDLQSLYQVPALDEQTAQRPRRISQSTFDVDKETWSTPMILLMTMAILLFVLFIICMLLIIDRYRDHCRGKKRVDRLARKKGYPNGKGAESDPRPLPSPPSWTYPQVIGAPPPRSPYNRLRAAAGLSATRNLHDDTGYDSDASMHYSRPFDDLGEITSEKTVLHTFGKQQSSSLYAMSPTAVMNT